MRTACTAILGVLALLAGCLGPEPGDDVPTVASPTAPPPAEPYVATCLNGLLFQFVDYAATDSYLPPGFHTRDPQDFLTFSPVAFGQAGVVVLMLDCVAADGTRYEAASVDIFVESPSVPGIEPAHFDFYEIERYGDPEEFDGVLKPSKWPRLPGWVNFTVDPEPVPSGLDVLVQLFDDAGEVMWFGGPASAPVDVGTGIVRFWHDGPLGLAYYQYDVVLDAHVGGGACDARPGTALAALAPNPVPLVETNFVCPPSSPVVATFPGLVINATAQFLPGVHAE